MHGPPRSSEGTITVDSIPVASVLKAGSNTIEAEAMHYNGRFEALGQAPGFLCELEYIQGGKVHVIGSDSTWESCEALAWSRQAPKFSYQRTFIEDYDARKEEDQEWVSAKEIGKVGIAPWKLVELRDIPLPDPRRTTFPSSVVHVQKGDGTVGELKGTPELESTRYGPRPEWCKRLQTENVQILPAVVTNPCGVTVKGEGDVWLKGDGASVV
ncbi:MAG: hypothetical protein ACP5E3_10045, partial [Bacteroidales bacterium]